jgi:succinate-semialdehyde dehydrogenase/glutarate-semialdehyde dehydrogenase
MVSDVRYPQPGLFIGGRWIAEPPVSASPVSTSTVRNPANGEVIGHVPHAGASQLDEAIVAAAAGFASWSRTSADDRAIVLHRAAELVRERQDAIARILTLEQGKPLSEARGEAGAVAAALEWSAEEGKRLHHRVLAPRAGSKRFTIRKEPVGVAAAFSPWNFPVSLAGRKVATALGAGCSIIIKPAEETPGSFLAVAHALADAGLPDGVLNVVFGNPAEVSRHLVASPIVRKIAFTGSTRVGKELAALAGAYAKPMVMELGGHAPVLVFDDAEVELAVKLSVASKFRNAGQVCVAPTRFLIHERLHASFVDLFCQAVEAIRVGDGLEAATTMGPLANARRVDAMERLLANALAHGAECRAGGARMDRGGYFFQPTVLTDVPDDARIMTEEPFGPVAVLNRFNSFDEAIARANGTPFALAAYAFSRSIDTIAAVTDALDAGMIGINGFTIAFADSPAGGRRDSGYGSEGGREGFDAYLINKCINEQ